MIVFLSKNAELPAPSCSIYRGFPTYHHRTIAGVAYTMGYPQILHFSSGFSIKNNMKNHPAIVLWLCSFPHFKLHGTHPKYPKWCFSWLRRLLGQPFEESSAGGSGSHLRAVEQEDTTGTGEAQSHGGISWISMDIHGSEIGSNDFDVHTHDGSMVLLYMVTWIPSIYPKC